MQRRPSSSRDRSGRRAEAFGVGTASSRAVASSAVAALDDDAAGFAGGAGGGGGSFAGGAGFLFRSFCCDHFAPTSGAGPRVFCAAPARRSRVASPVSVFLRLKFGDDDDYVFLAFVDIGV